MRYIHSASHESAYLGAQRVTPWDPGPNRHIWPVPKGHARTIKSRWAARASLAGWAGSSPMWVSPKASSDFGQPNPEPECLRLRRMQSLHPSPPGDDPLGSLSLSQPPSQEPTC
jgi:hypothetical protein